jgi:hypothetical protein
MHFLERHPWGSMVKTAKKPTNLFQMSLRGFKNASPVWTANALDKFSIWDANVSKRVVYSPSKMDHPANQPPEVSNELELAARGKINPLLQSYDLR